MPTAIVGTAPPRCGGPVPGAAATPGYGDRTCTPGPLTESARSGEYDFRNDLVDSRGEYVVVAKRDARIGDRLSATLARLDAPGLIGLPPFAAEPTTSQGLVFKVGVYKPAGAGCWRVDLMDPATGRFLASYVVLVRDP